jgi:hypothetical protein
MNIEKSRHRSEIKRRKVRKYRNMEEKMNLDGRIATAVEDLTSLDGCDSSHIGGEIDVKLRSEGRRRIVRKSFNTACCVGGLFWGYL